jgi:hypothetical protein
MGTPFWNSENLSGEDAIDTNQSYMRFYNRLRVKSELFDNFNIQVNAVRSDNISGDNSASETKLYEVYARYNLSNGYIKLGRFTEFNKWTLGSVDGAAISYKLFEKFTVNAYGGMDVKYGKIYDSDNQNVLVYGDVAYKEKSYGGKVKFMHTDEFDVTGAELYSRFGAFVLSGNTGYDLKNSRIHDGGLGVSGALTNKIRLFGHYHFMRPVSFWNGYIMPEIYQNINLGLSYRLPWNLSLSGIQAATVTDSNKTYITNVSLSHKYFTFGVNYLSGDSYYNKFGISLGGRYSPIDDLMLNLGIASVDNMINFNQYESNYQSIASYFRANYKFLNNFVLSCYANYYHTDSQYIDNIRGGATLQFNFGGGK